MAIVFTKTFLRRRKSLFPGAPYQGPVFPLRELPYELQLMIGHQCVLSSVPIIVGKSITKWHLDAEEELEARFCKSMLTVSKDFRDELYRTYYEENTFEMAYYYNQTNFFRIPGAKLVQYVIVDALRVLVQPAGIPSTIAENLKMLPRLKKVSIRLRGTLAHNQSRYGAALENFMRRLAEVLSLETIELLIEPVLQPDMNEDQKLQEFKDFLVRQMAGSKPKCKAELLHVSPSTLERHASNTDEKPIRSRRISSLISSRRSSTTST